MWVDQNAFGFLIVYFDVEEDEYALEREAFVERFEEFRRAVYDFVAGRSPGAGVRGLDLGHGIYFELESGDETVDPFVWARELRAALGEAGFVTAATITHGSRWAPEAEAPSAHTQLVGTAEVTAWSRPSEPLRKALYADTATRPDADGEGGWGPGLYVDTEAVEALGRTPKNAPTALEVAGAAFYRVTR